MTRAILAISVLVLAAAAPLSAQDFSNHWHDGKAELDGYTWNGVRYGEERSGECVMIFVTEPWSESKRVKVDDPSRNPEDVFNVLKLNLVRDFQTGVYDYNTMVSVFARTADFTPAKITFSSAEWCGHVYSELGFNMDEITESTWSYFENETRSRKLPVREGGVCEDNLFILLRGLRKPFLEPGERVTLAFLPGTFTSRLTHRAPEWTAAEISRSEKGERVTVPAGSFDATVYRVETREGRVGTFYIEDAYPHRILRWSWKAPPGQEGMGGTESGELTGSARLVYWNLNDNGQESYRKDLGLD